MEEEWGQRASERSLERVEKAANELEYVSLNSSMVKDWVKEIRMLRQIIVYKDCQIKELDDRIDSLTKEKHALYDRMNKAREALGLWEDWLPEDDPYDDEFYSDFGPPIYKVERKD